MQENNDKSNMLLLGKISKKSLIRAGKKKQTYQLKLQRQEKKQ